MTSKYIQITLFFIEDFLIIHVIILIIIYAIFSINLKFLVVFIRFTLTDCAFTINFQIQKLTQSLNWFHLYRCSVLVISVFDLFPKVMRSSSFFELTLCQYCTQIIGEYLYFEHSKYVQFLRFQIILSIILLSNCDLDF